MALIPSQPRDTLGSLSEGECRRFSISNRSHAEPELSTDLARSWELDRISIPHVDDQTTLASTETCSLVSYGLCEAAGAFVSNESVTFKLHRHASRRRQVSKPKLGGWSSTFHGLTEQLLSVVESRGVSR